MDLSGFKDYIRPELLVLIPVLYFAGSMLKDSRAVESRFIPSVLGCLGMLLALLWCIGNDGVSLGVIFTSLTQGILCAGMSVYANQLVKHRSKSGSGRKRKDG